MDGNLYNLLFNNNLIVLPIALVFLLVIGGIGYLFLRGYKSGSSSPMMRVLAVILALIFGGVALLRISEGLINIGFWVAAITMLIFAVGGNKLLDQVQGRRNTPTE
jgi:hypothetical protein